MRVPGSWLAAICVGWAMMSSPVSAAIGSAATPAPAESESLRVILDAFLSISALMPGIRSHIGAQVQDLMQRDTKVDRALKANPALRTALVERAAARYDSLLQERLPIARASFSRGLRTDMTAPQLAATARFFLSETGKGLIAAIVTKMLSATDEESDELEFSDGEAAALVNPKDVPAILAFEKTGAAAKLDKVTSRLDEAETQFEPMVEDDELLLGILEQLQSVTNYPT